MGAVWGPYGGVRGALKRAYRLRGTLDGSQRRCRRRISISNAQSDDVGVERKIHAVAAVLRRERWTSRRPHPMAPLLAPFF